jgi:hypothetical protein
MRLILQVDQALADALLRSKEMAPNASEIRALLSRAQAVLGPMHPGTQGTELGLYFAVDVPDGQAQDLQEALLKTQGVTAAYMQPPEDLPI